MIYQADMLIEINYIKANKFHDYFKIIVNIVLNMVEERVCAAQRRKRMKTMSFNSC